MITNVGKHPLYHTYNSMLKRCYNEQSDAYRFYGARGIRVCERWRESFWNFVEDMGEKPPLYNLDRVDNDGDYTPENCRWVTRKENCRNTRRNVVLTIDGVTKPLIQWCEERGVNYQMVIQRVRDYGYSAEDALNVPKNAHCKISDMVGHKGAKPITFNGETHTRTKWARIFGISQPTMSKHVRRYGEQGAIQLHFIKSGALTDSAS